MPVHAPEIPEVPAEPKRVLWASVLMLLGFVFFQTLVTFPLRDIFNGYFPTGLAHLAFIAAFTVLFLIREKQSRVYGGIVVGFGFLYIIVSGLLWRQMHPANNLFLGIRDYFFQGIMAVGFGWLFTRSEYEKTKKINWLRAGIGAALSELILIVGIIVFVIKGVNLSLVINLILPIFCIWLFVLFLEKTQRNAKQRRASQRIRFILGLAFNDCDDDFNNQFGCFACKWKFCSIFFSDRANNDMGLRCCRLSVNDSLRESDCILFSVRYCLG